MRTSSHDLESEKFHCESWPRKFNGIIQLGIEMVRRNPWNPRIWILEFETSIVQGKNCRELVQTQKNLSFLHILIFSSCQNLMMSPSLMRVEHHQLMIEMLISSSNTVTDTSQNNILPVIWGFLPWSSKQTLSITMLFTNIII